MLSLIDSEPTRTVSGLGIISREMTTTLGQRVNPNVMLTQGFAPEILAAPVPYPIFDDSAVPVVDFGLGVVTMEPGHMIAGGTEDAAPVIDFGLGTNGAYVGVAVAGSLLSIAAAAAGAYLGARRSPAWAAGGAALGLVAIGVAGVALNAVLSAGTEA